MMTDKEQFELAENTWDEVYPDRKAFADIGSSAQKEWIKVFAAYRTHLSKFLVDGIKRHLTPQLLEKLIEHNETSP